MLFVALILFNITKNKEEEKKKKRFLCLRKHSNFFFAQDILLDKHLRQEGVKILKLMKCER